MNSNKLNFVLTGTAVNQPISFAWSGEFSCDPAKNFQTVLINQSANMVQIIIKADHHGSPTPAGWYKDFVAGKTEHMMHTEHGSNVPEKLNFAIKGTLTIGKQTYQICVGQGHYSTTNNWHLCSESIRADSDNKNGFLGKQQYYLKQSGAYDFEIENVGDMKSCKRNQFILKTPGGLEEFSFNVTGYSISDHEPYAGVEYSHTSDEGQIVVRAGRHKTVEVKDWFNGQVHPTASKGAAIGTDSKSTFPAELNFAVKGDLKYKLLGETVVVKDFVLAQGSSLDGMIDNWWAGGPNMHGVSLPVAGGMIAQKIESKAVPPKLRETTWNAIIGKDHQMNMQIQNIL